MGNDNTPTRSEEVEINLGEYFAILRKNGWKIVLFSLAVGLVTLLVMFLLPNIYQASAVITPAVQDKRGKSRLRDARDVRGRTSEGRPRSRTWNLSSRATTSPCGSSGNTTSGRSCIRTGSIPRPGRSEIHGRPVCSAERNQGRPETGTPSVPRRIRLKVFVNRRAGTLSVSFESSSPAGSADIVKYYLDEGKNRLQEEALDRASQKQEVHRGADRDRRCAHPRPPVPLLGQEVEQEMMARNREQFGFRVIDSPRVPDRKSKPERARSAVTATVLSFLLACIFLVFRNKPPH